MFKSNFKTEVKNEEELKKIITNYIGVYDDSTQFVKDLYSSLSELSKEIIEEGEGKYTKIHYPCELEIEFIQIKYGCMIQVMVKTITVNERGFDMHAFLNKSRVVNQLVWYDEADIPEGKIVFNLKGFPLLNNILDGKFIYLKHDIKNVGHVALSKEM